MDGGKYVSRAKPATVFLQYANDEPFLNADMAKQYFEIVSAPKKFKVYDAPHALNDEATRDRIAFLAEQLSFKPPDAKALSSIPALVQPLGQNRTRTLNAVGTKAARIASRSLELEE